MRKYGRVLSINEWLYLLCLPSLSENGRMEMGNEIKLDPHTTLQCFFFFLRDFLIFDRYNLISLPFLFYDKLW